MKAVISTNKREDGTLEIYCGQSLLAEIKDGEQTEEFVKGVLHDMNYIWNADGTISPKEIRFVDSNYNDLFNIPNGGIIAIKYPDGHIENRLCKYIDDYHTEINGVCYHICQWAEIMEENGRTFYPAGPPRYDLQDITPEEFELMYARKDESIDRGCIGHLRADFDAGDLFFSSWWNEDGSLKTTEFKKEFDNIINYFQKESYAPFLKSRSDMYNVIRMLKPIKMEHDNDVYGFKVETEHYTYYFRCNPQIKEYNVYAYCYNSKKLKKVKKQQKC